MIDSESAARALLEARRCGQLLDALPAGGRPASDPDAYRIQDAQLGALGPIGGWKVGARSADSEPSCAPLPRGLVFRSGHAFSPRSALRLVEAEIGFTVGRDLPPRGHPYDVDEVVDAMTSVQATLEVLESRYRNRTAMDPFSQLADFGSNGALVVGPGRSTGLHIDQTRAHLRVHCNGMLDYEVTGGNAAGDVLRLLAWLANHAAIRVGGLRAGEVITTGSCVGVREIPAGARIRAEFDGIPAVEACL